MAKALDNLHSDYFNWMCDLIRDKKHPKRALYQTLLSYLNEREFTYILDMDGNRAEDGIDLRYRFAYENGYDYRMVACYLDNGPCTILEMMVALAIRCEEHIMWDSDIGDQTGKWFWMMISNLGLDSMTDSRFDLRYTDEVLDRFLDRTYKRNGEGGLFTVENCEYDMRTIDIWYQLHRYLRSKR